MLPQSDPRVDEIIRLLDQASTLPPVTPVTVRGQAMEDVIVNALGDIAVVKRALYEFAEGKTLSADEARALACSLEHAEERINEVTDVLKEPEDVSSLWQRGGGKSLSLSVQIIREINKIFRSPVQTDRHNTIKRVTALLTSLFPPERGKGSAYDYDLASVLHAYERIRDLITEGKKQRRPVPLKPVIEHWERKRGRAAPERNRSDIVLDNREKPSRVTTTLIALWQDNEYKRVEKVLAAYRKFLKKPPPPPSPPTS